MENESGKKKHYIVLDLEWNQCADGKTGSVPDMPFEIIELGAVKLDENFDQIGEFSRIIRPAVYKKLHYKVLEIMHIGMDELRKSGEPFSSVIREFFAWCTEKAGEESILPVFCIWGNMDLTELQRNMKYHGIENPFSYPLLYYDVQKLFNLLYGEGSKDKLPLDRAAEILGILPDRPFHRALDDAYYTGRIMKEIDFRSVQEYLSMDYYRLPQDREEEIYLIFPNYSKYVSREFDSKEEAIADKTVTDMICYRCNRMLHKKIRWFSANQKNYYCLAWCPEHGFVRGKIRMKNASDGKICAIKTIKLVGEDGAEKLKKKKEETAFKRNMKNRLKRQRKRNAG